MLATTATRIAGTAAINEKRATIRTCSRAAARPRLRACSTRQTSRPMNVTRSRTAKAFTSNSVRTTSCVGRIGVRFASTTNVARADNNARETAIEPMSRAIQPGVGAVAVAAANWAVATWLTFVMKSEHQYDGVVMWIGSRWRFPLGQPYEAFIQQC